MRLSWGLADQAASSVSNFVVGIYVARSLGVTAFGVFSLAWVTYGVVLNVSRGLATDPLVVRFSGVPGASWRGAVSRSTGTALVVGAALGAVCLMAGIGLGGRVGPAFAALGVMMPGLLLQDAWRFSFFAMRRRAEGVRQRRRVGCGTRPGHGGGGPCGQRGRLRARLGRVRHGGGGVRLPPVGHPAPDDRGTRVASRAARSRLPVPGRERQPQWREPAAGVRARRDRRGRRGGCGAGRRAPARPVPGGAHGAFAGHRPGGGTGAAAGPASTGQVLPPPWRGAGRPARCSGARRCC